MILRRRLAPEQRVDRPAPLARDDSDRACDARPTYGTSEGVPCVSSLRLGLGVAAALVAVCGTERDGTAASAGRRGDALCRTPRGPGGVPAGVDRDAEQKLGLDDLKPTEETVC